MSFNTISEWLSLNSNLLLGATWETLYMVAVAGIVGFAVGIPLGVILHTTKKGGLLENTKLNRVLGAIVN
ncbi:methionine ABC transporter permease, partial [Vibrio rotiferianus]